MIQIHKSLANSCQLSNKASEIINYKIILNQECVQSFLRLILEFGGSLLAANIAAANSRDFPHDEMPQFNNGDY